MRSIWLSLLVTFACLGLPAQALAPHATPLDALLLPRTPVKTLQAGGKSPVYLQLSQRPHTEVLSHYLALTHQNEWKLDFPSLSEAQIWVQALKKSREPEVFMLNLSHRKSKFNAYLTIGALTGTSAQAGRTIITIYTTPQAFGRSGR
jgi:hypothetical protein